ncbi:Sensor kinase CusS [Prochlorococcus marinus str. MIT 1313]|uniref:histidine kinase dimerization/phospho-acceptor domain-containing protein n=1 Tax=Prochlorococcus TaxID=1218 RepID=UPI0007BC2DF9|nr:histidine kinase dimerization/phospho-acceptor domain-containing protein [Prochlorococcus marinus]KZR70041.1 Sensor kinase CusS [Prochlorococcus marinus str. MIT 1313]KZR72765.1 Sensor kinase CusS [Prochlorococcus marinus str. MIT 1318]
MHPKGFEAGFVVPDVSGGINLGKVLAFYGLQKYQGDAKYGPALIDIDSVYYLIIKDEIELHGNTWNIYLVEDISRQIRQQEVLAWVLILAALLASMVTLLLTRSGIRRGLDPLQHFGGAIESVSSGSLDDHRFDPKYEPVELKPLAGSFNAILDRLAESWNRQRKFANALSHELRTPITLIIGYTSRVLRRSGSLSDAQRHN